MQALCLFVGLLILLPILYACSVSFMEEKDILTRPTNLIPPSPTLDNYISVFTGTPIGRFMVNSFIVALVSSTSRLILAVMAAYSFAFFEFKGKNLLFSLTLATIMIPSDILVVQNYATISRLHLINTYLGMCSVFLVAATNIFLLRQNFLSYPKELKDAASIDGCGSLSFLTRILIPTSKSVLTTVFVSSFVSMWNQYTWPMIVTTKNEMRTIQVGITMLKNRDVMIFGPIMAAVCMAIVPSLLIFLVFRKNIIAGMMSGAVKQ